MEPLKKETRVKTSADYLFPSSFSVITTSLTCQYASPFTFFPSLGVWPRQIPAMSPRFLDENSNLSTFPLKMSEKKNKHVGPLLGLNHLLTPTSSHSQFALRVINFFF